MSSEDPRVLAARKRLTAIINSYPQTRESLEEMFGEGQVWDHKQLEQDFQVHEFRAPFVVVTRRSDDVIGSVYFQHAPRLYFGFEVHNG